MVECGVGGNERKSLSVYRREDVNLCVGLRVVRMSRVISIQKKPNQSNQYYKGVSGVQEKLS